MNTKFNLWLWPARAMGKRYVKVLQDEHNALVNSHQQLVEACNVALDALCDAKIDSSVSFEFASKLGKAKGMLKTAIATASGHLKGVQK